MEALDLLLRAGLFNHESRLGRFLFLVCTGPVEEEDMGFGDESVDVSRARAAFSASPSAWRRASKISLSSINDAHFGDRRLETIAMRVSVSRSDMPSESTRVVCWGSREVRTRTGICDDE